MTSTPSTMFDPATEPTTTEQPTVVVAKAIAPVKPKVARTSTRKVTSTQATVPAPAAPSAKAVRKPAAQARAKVVTPVPRPAARRTAAQPAPNPAATDLTVATTVNQALAEPTAPKPEKLLKEKKPKLVRDSFTMPKLEYLLLDQIKQRSAGLGVAVKKSELIRAGIKALAEMPDAALLVAIKAVPTIKTGRPLKD